MVTVADVRTLALTLPRTTEHLIRDRVKFRVGAIVYVAFSRDEATMGFAYPKYERDSLVAAEPGTFFLPGASDLRFNWLCCHLDRLDHDDMTGLVCEAWRMVRFRGMRNCATVSSTTFTAEPRTVSDDAQASCG